MKAKEAKARIKINMLLEEAGWRFFDDENGPANIQLEANVKLTKKQIDEYGENFEKVKMGLWISSFWTRMAGHSLCWKQNQKILIRWLARNRRVIMPNLNS